MMSLFSSNSSNEIIITLYQPECKNVGGGKRILAQKVCVGTKFKTFNTIIGQLVDIYKNNQCSSDYYIVAKKDDSIITIENYIFKQDHTNKTGLDEYTFLVEKTKL